MGKLQAKSGNKEIETHSRYQRNSGAGRRYLLYIDYKSYLPLRQMASIRDFFYIGANYRPENVLSALAPSDTSTRMRPVRAPPYAGK